MNRDEIVERLGGENWNDVLVWFGGMSESEILAELDRVFPGDDNGQLSASIAAGIRYGDAGPSARAEF